MRERLKEIGLATGRTDREMIGWVGGGPGGTSDRPDDRGLASITVICFDCRCIELPQKYADSIPQLLKEEILLQIHAYQILTLDKRYYNLLKGTKSLCSIYIRSCQRDQPSTISWVCLFPVKVLQCPHLNFNLKSLNLYFLCQNQDFTINASVCRK